MAGATALEAGHFLSSTCMCPTYLSRAYCVTGLGGNRCVLLSPSRNFLPPGRSRRWQVKSLVMKPSDGAQDNGDDFVKRMEQTWSITKQPRPVKCKSCDADGQVDCPWCKGTGFFILGDNMLCEIPSRNTTCRVCFGKGMLPCDDCKGTGFRAKWLGEPQKPKRKDG